VKFQFKIQPFQSAVLDKNKSILPTQGDEVEFYKQVADLLAAARGFAKQQLDSVIVTTYYEVGRLIVEREQQGQKRAQYGTKLIKGLSEYLTEQYGRGFSIVNLQSMRKFYQIYTPSIQQSLTAKSQAGKSMVRVFDAGIEAQQPLGAKFKLSWTQYQILMRIKLVDARHFYEIEYSLYLPDKALLQRKLAEWTAEFEETHGGDSA
jgi:hypothetical protein